MKIAALSDIHGNDAAFKACVEYALAQDIHIFFFLGDYVAEFPYPQRTMELLYEMQEKYDCYFIRGNKEDYWLDCKYNPDCVWKTGNHTVGAMKYTYGELKERDFTFFKGLPISRRVEFEGSAPIMLCHGSTERNNQKMLPEDEETERIMEGCDCKYILCGHTHGQMMLEHAEKVVWNPGAVGVTKHSGGKAQFMILHQNGKEWEPEFVSLEYEKEQIFEDLQESGLEQMAPYWTQITRHLLQTGENPHAETLFYAMDLDTAENGSSTWYKVADKYWIKAITDLIVEKEITLGQSGAHVYELDEHRVLKVVLREDIADPALWASYEKEALVYEKVEAAFLPKIYVNIHTEDAIFLIMEKYEALSREQLDDCLLQNIMDRLAQIHKLPMPDFLSKAERHPAVFEAGIIDECKQGWESILSEHPGVFDSAPLNEIGEKINTWNKMFFDKIACFNHGDFHFENLLTDKAGNIVVVDWQNCGRGNVAGDISFLISRLTADGYAMEQEKVLEMYCESAQKCGRNVSAETIQQQISLANLNTSFRYWHMYLHGSEEKRVRDIYERMLGDAKALADYEYFVKTH